MEISTGYTVGAYSLIVAVVASYVYLRVIKPNPRARQPVTRPQPVAAAADKAEPKKKKKPAKKDDKKEEKPKEAKPKDTKPKDTKPAEKAAESANEAKEQKAKKDKKKKNAAKDAAAPKEAARAAPEVDLAGVADEEEAPVDDREFARQLSSLKEGTKFDGRRSAADAAANRHKSVKQSRAAKAAADVAAADDAHDHEDSSPSASAEHTPDASPELAPADSTGVADMLAPAPAGPSVLRLVDTEEDSKPKHAPKPKEVKETKKQRQNKRKNDELKAAREAAEVERKQLEEAQRRTARIAEGRPARDGSQFMAAANPPAGASAWAAGGGGGATSSAATPSAMTPSSSYELLDTAGDAPKPTARKIDDSWMSELPSEEEQIKMAKADAEWSTVTTKASKKARKDAEDSSAPAASEAAPAAATLPTPEASFERPAPPKAAKATGSFAALSAPEDEQEIEWDV